jgi:uroporphyrinogen-III decarboxylase
MKRDLEELHAERLNRYVTAMRNERPDKVPIRPFVAEFVADYAGYDHQQVTHDYELIFEATRKCAADFDWDATAGNLIWNYVGVIKTVGWNCFAFPGIEVPAGGVAQYVEPPVEKAFMKPEEYDELVDDPTAFLFNVWLPRFTEHVRAPGEPVTFEHNMALLNGGMSVMSYNLANARQAGLLRTETGTVQAIAGLLKAPLDILGDKLRGYYGVAMDLMERPEDVKRACEALMPHLLAFALAGADPERNVPLTMWMHRSCVPFVSHEHFDGIYWPTLKPIIEEIWSRGHQTIFYAEGDWDAHLETFAELPEKSIIYHVDRGDIFKAHEILGHRFCLSGGIPNHLLSHGSPDDVRACCKKVIDGVASDGGYIMDAGAIIMDASVENVRAMTDFTREYGVYDSAPSGPAAPTGVGAPGGESLMDRSGQKRRPGVCIPWTEKRREIPSILGDEALVRQVWEKNDAPGYYFIWENFMW